ncbi:MAG: lipid kinase [Phycisphaerae bacterium]|nr:MAG: lipid kinase [Phycisphaerae bacterium]
MTKPFLFLANRQARQCALRARQAETEFQKTGVPLIKPDLSNVRDLSRLILDHADKVDRVIVVGGDGSINSTLSGLLKTQLPLGIIPAGTANDLARTLNLPDTPVEAARLILSDQKRVIDVAQVNDHLFINAASLGLSVNITRQLTRSLKKRWGPFAYALASARAVFRAKPFHVHVTTEQEKVYLKTVQLVVGNGRYFGTGMTVHEQADIDDHSLDLYSVGVYHWWSILALLPSLRWGTHQSYRSVYNARGRRFRIETRVPRPITADGEILTHTPADFLIHPKALTVFAPGMNLPTLSTPKI